MSLWSSISNAVSSAANKVSSAVKSSTKSTSTASKSTSSSISNKAAQKAAAAKRAAQAVAAKIAAERTAAQAAAQKLAQEAVARLAAERAAAIIAAQIIAAKLAAERAAAQAAEQKLAQQAAQKLAAERAAAAKIAQQAAAKLAAERATAQKAAQQVAQAAAAKLAAEKAAAIKAAQEAAAKAAAQKAAAEKATAEARAAATKAAQQAAQKAAQEKALAEQAAATAQRLAQETAAKIAAERAVAQRLAQQTAAQAAAKLTAEKTAAQQAAQRVAQQTATAAKTLTAGKVAVVSSALSNKRLGLGVTVASANTGTQTKSYSTLSGVVRSAQNTISNDITAAKKVVSGEESSIANTVRNTNKKQLSGAIKSSLVDAVAAGTGLSAVKNVTGIYGTLTGKTATAIGASTRVPASENYSHINGWGLTTKDTKDSIISRNNKASFVGNALTTVGMSKDTANKVSGVTYNALSGASAALTGANTKVAQYTQLLPDADTVESTLEKYRAEKGLAATPFGVPLTIAGKVYNTVEDTINKSPSLKSSTAGKLIVSSIETQKSVASGLAEGGKEFTKEEYDDIRTKPVSKALEYGSYYVGGEVAGIVTEGLKLKGASTILKVAETRKNPLAKEGLTLLGKYGGKAVDLGFTAQILGSGYGAAKEGYAGGSNTQKLTGDGNGGVVLSGSDTSSQKGGYVGVGKALTKFGLDFAIAGAGYGTGAKAVHGSSLFSKDIVKLENAPKTYTEEIASKVKDNTKSTLIAAKTKIGDNLQRAKITVGERAQNTPGIKKIYDYQAKKNAGKASSNAAEYTTIEEVNGKLVFKTRPTESAINEAIAKQKSNMKRIEKETASKARQQKVKELIDDPINNAKRSLRVKTRTAKNDLKKSDVYQKYLEIQDKRALNQSIKRAGQRLADRPSTSNWSNRELSEIPGYRGDRYETIQVGETSAQRIIRLRNEAQAKHDEIIAINKQSTGNEESFFEKKYMHEPTAEEITAKKIENAEDLEAADMKESILREQETKRLQQQAEQELADMKEVAHRFDNDDITVKRVKQDKANQFEEAESAEFLAQKAEREAAEKKAKQDKVDQFDMEELSHNLWNDDIMMRRANDAEFDQILITKRTALNEKKAKTFFEKEYMKDTPARDNPGRPEISEINKRTATPEMEAKLAKDGKIASAIARKQNTEFAIKKLAAVERIEGMRAIHAKRNAEIIKKNNELKLKKEADQELYDQYHKELAEYNRAVTMSKEIPGIKIPPKPVNPRFANTPKKSINELFGEKHSSYDLMKSRDDAIVELKSGQKMMEQRAERERVENLPQPEAEPTEALMSGEEAVNAVRVALGGKEIKKLSPEESLDAAMTTVMAKLKKDEALIDMIKGGKDPEVEGMLKEQQKQKTYEDAHFRNRVELSKREAAKNTPEAIARKELYDIRRDESTQRRLKNLADKKQMQLKSKNNVKHDDLNLRARQERASFRESLKELKEINAVKENKPDHDSLNQKALEERAKRLEAQREMREQRKRDIQNKIKEGFEPAKLEKYETTEEALSNDADYGAWEAAQRAEMEVATTRTEDLYKKPAEKAEIITEEIKPEKEIVDPNSDEWEALETADVAQTSSTEGLFGSKDVETFLGKKAHKIAVESVVDSATVNGKPRTKNHGAESRSDSSSGGSAVDAGNGLKLMQRTEVKPKVKVESALKQEDKLKMLKPMDQKMSGRNAKSPIQTHKPALKEIVKPAEAKVETKPELQDITRTIRDQKLGIKSEKQEIILKKRTKEDALEKLEEINNLRRGQRREKRNEDWLVKEREKSKSRTADERAKEKEREREEKEREKKIEKERKEVEEAERKEEREREEKERKEREKLWFLGKNKKEGGFLGTTKPRSTIKPPENKQKDVPKPPENKQKDILRPPEITTKNDGGEKPKPKPKPPEPIITPDTRHDIINPPKPKPPIIVPPIVVPPAPDNPNPIPDTPKPTEGSKPDPLTFYGYWPYPNQETPNQPEGFLPPGDGIGRISRYGKRRLKSQTKVATFEDMVGKNKHATLTNNKKAGVTSMVSSSVKPLPVKKPATKSATKSRSLTLPAAKPTAKQAKTEKPSMISGKKTGKSESGMTKKTGKPKLPKNTHDILRITCPKR